MDVSVDGAAMRRLDQFLDEIGKFLLNAKQRASFAVYALGLLGDGERKSIEPIAARACADPEHVAAMEARLGHLLNDAKWSDEGVRGHAAHYAIGEMTKRDPVENWIVDDTGMLKQGKHSVGVQRQYTGSAGKTTNCQVAVSLTIATRSAHVPIDFELYLPECWANDAKRRAEARIPDDVVFRTKLELAMGMIRRAKENGVPPGVVLVDTAYGNANWFRMEVRALGLDYAVAVLSTTTVLRLDRLERTYGDAMSVEALGTWLAEHGKFRRCTWREGTRNSMTAKFAAVRVVTAHHDAWSDVRDREALWLVIEWPDGEAAPTKYYLSSLPIATSRKTLVRTIKERYRTERTYEDLKGEIGFDHFEGRRWPGWHHHVSVALCCFAFLVAEQVRRFPPSTGSAEANDSIFVAA